jgi:hypothetical protein
MKRELVAQSDAEIFHQLIENKYVCPDLELLIRIGKPKMEDTIENNCLLVRLI